MLAIVRTLLSVLVGSNLRLNFASSMLVLLLMSNLNLGM